MFFFSFFFFSLPMVYNGRQVHQLWLDTFPHLIRTVVLTYTVQCSTPVGAQRVETSVPADCWTGACSGCAVLLQLSARPCNRCQCQPAKQGGCRPDRQPAGCRRCPGETHSSGGVSTPWARRHPQGSLSSAHGELNWGAEHNFNPWQTPCWLLAVR